MQPATVTPPAFDAEHTASIYLQVAARDMLLAWATKSTTLAAFGMDALEEAARALGYTLTPITTPAEDHATAIARRVAEDGPAVTMVAADDRPVTFATTDEGRR